MAQLGARFHGMEEVVGSIPTRSTKDSTSHRALLCEGGLSHSPQGLCVSAGAGCASSEDESLWLVDNYIQSCLDQLVRVPANHDLERSGFHNSVHLAIQEGKFSRFERQFNRSGFAGTERDVPEAAQFLHRPSDRADLVANVKLTLSPGAHRWPEDNDLV